jgi:hypothetical protein
VGGRAGFSTAEAARFSVFSNSAGDRVAGISLARRAIVASEVNCSSSQPAKLNRLFDGLEESRWAVAVLALGFASDEFVEGRGPTRSISLEG